MTELGEKIHAFWYCLVAVKVVLGKMPKAKAEREAYDVIVERYGEEKLLKEFELGLDSFTSTSSVVPVAPRQV